MSYSNSLFSQLLPALKEGILSPEDRLGLLSDVLSLVSRRMNHYMARNITLLIGRSFTCQHLTVMGKASCKKPLIPYFLKISPRRDLISKHCTMRRQFEGGIYRDQYAHAYTASIISVFDPCIMRVRLCRSLATPYHAARF